MIFIDAFFSFAAGGRHHLALPRLLGNCIAVIGHQLGVDAVIRTGRTSQTGRTRRTERWGVCPKKRIRLTWAGALVGLILIIKSRRLLYLVDGFLDALEY